MPTDGEKRVARCHSCFAGYLPAVVRVGRRALMLNPRAAVLRRRELTCDGSGCEIVTL